MDHIDQLVKAKLIENISIINKVISCASKSKFNLDYAYHTQFRMEKIGKKFFQTVPL